MCTKVKVSVVPRRGVAVDSVKSFDDLFLRMMIESVQKCVYNQQRSRTLSNNNFERLWFSNRYDPANMSSRSRPSNVRVTGAKRAQRGTQFSIEVSRSLICSLKRKRRQRLRSKPYAHQSFLLFSFSLVPHGESTTKNTCSHVGCTSHWAPATTACRLPWLGGGRARKWGPIGWKRKQHGGGHG